MVGFLACPCVVWKHSSQLKYHKTPLKKRELLYIPVRYYSVFPCSSCEIKHQEEHKPSECVEQVVVQNNSRTVVLFQPRIPGNTGIARLWLLLLFILERKYW